MRVKVRTSQKECDRRLEEASESESRSDLGESKTSLDKTIISSYWENDKAAIQNTAIEIS